MLADLEFRCGLFHPIRWSSRAFALSGSVGSSRGSL